MKESTLRLRYWRIVLFFGRVVFGFIAWEVVGPRLGLRRLAERTREQRLQRTANQELFDSERTCQHCPYD